jgi:UTP--glucose-1-phosphate uridylyltransferase
VTHIRKAVFPVAGLGTRFLPATKAVPKEMLPVVDKPLIQYATEEAIAAGIRELIFVVSRTKNSIQDHYDRAHDLESVLAGKGRQELLDVIRAMVPPGVQCAWVRQAEPRGLGHAVLCARSLVGNEPFAVILPDDLIEDGSRGCLRQMVEAHARHGGSMLAVEPVPREHSDRYGIVSGTPVTGSIGRVDGVVEKPRPAEAPSNMAIVGRYILSPAIFGLLEDLPAGTAGEIQLTDAIAALLGSEPVFSCRFEGTRYDCGSKLGFLQATLAHALRDAEVNTSLLDWWERRRSG